jgi:hypothetical protein
MDGRGVCCVEINARIVGYDGGQDPVKAHAVGVVAIEGKLKRHTVAVIEARLRNAVRHRIPEQRLN